MSPTRTAAAGDRSAAGRAAGGEDSAAQTHAEAAGSPGGEQKDREDQAQRQRKGTLLLSTFLPWLHMSKQVNFFVPVDK